MAHILLTGYMGYIGSHFCQRLPGYIGIDIKEGQDYRLQKNGIHNTVVHLAASVSVTEITTRSGFCRWKRATHEMKIDTEELSRLSYNSQKRA